MPMFETFRAELDEHHDRRERVIKASRDITASSKKMYKSHSNPLPDGRANFTKNIFVTEVLAMESLLD